LFVFLFRVDCFVVPYFDCAQQPPRNDAFSRVRTSQQKSVIANEVKQSIYVLTTTLPFLFIFGY